MCEIPMGAEFSSFEKKLHTNRRLSTLGMYSMKTYLRKKYEENAKSVASSIEAVWKRCVRVSKRVC